MVRVLQGIILRNFYNRTLALQPDVRLSKENFNHIFGMKPDGIGFIYKLLLCDKSNRLYVVELFIVGKAVCKYTV